MSDEMLGFPACFTAGKYSLPSSGICMTQYARDVENRLPADIPDPHPFTEKPARPWLNASELSLLGEEGMA